MLKAIDRSIDVLSHQNVSPRTHSDSFVLGIVREKKKMHLVQALDARFST